MDAQVFLARGLFGYAFVRGKKMEEKERKQKMLKNFVSSKPDSMKHLMIVQLLRNFQSKMSNQNKKATFENLYHVNTSLNLLCTSCHF